MSDENEKKLDKQAVTAKQKERDLQNDLLELGKSKSMLGAMAVLPPDANFETKDEEEQVVLVLRRHFVTNAPWIIGSSLLFLLPWFILLIGFFPAGLSVRYQYLILVVANLMVLGYALEQFLIWFFNVYILTNERIVDIDFYNLLNREISDADLDKIQDVTIKGQGIGAAIFHYGDILIQTAGEKQVFEFIAVPQPEIVSRVLREMIEFCELNRKEGNS